MASDARPAQPKSILRGHKTQVHAAVFVRSNERLLTGDADGFVVVWDLIIMRTRAVWQAHTGGILGIAGWGPDKIITHGRDNKLVVWKLGVEDEARMSTVLPLDPSKESRPHPWILHMLEVNTMNFCSFSYCPASPGSTYVPHEILIAVPNTLASEAVDIFHLPSQSRRHTVKLGDKNGMVMALSLFYQAQFLTLVAGYENGAVIVAQFDDHCGWTVRYQAKCHSQPVLSLDLSPSKDFFLTSSADSIIAKHPLPEPDLNGLTTPEAAPPTLFNRERGTEDNSKEASVSPGSEPAGASLISAALKKESRAVPTRTSSAESQVQTQPLVIVNTKHSGQQSLKVRSDGRIFATAGWDTKIRVYSAKTLKEVAVLKWHQVGCYAAAFAEIEEPAEHDSTGGGSGTSGTSGTSSLDSKTWDEDPAGSLLAQEIQQENFKSTSVTLVPKLTEVTVREKRMRQAKTGHWLAAGSKDGKVSLWDVF
ncbi:WD40-repeat-containing domain protein [Podospora didyma]|uniref:ASTRA-associated protein 1 n=1 Tax=Podospora didyma TaxID=330526 RepID=A0AAE0NY36_9PEZI|nr:WD40-repeat-containing domain protein [Podospora didyma]